MRSRSPSSPPSPASPGSPGSPESPQFSEHLERVRHCIDVTVRHLTTIKEMIPTDAELKTASRRRAPIDPGELARHRAELELAMREMAKLARVLIDQSRASAGLDPQCCDWPSFDEMKTGEC